MILSYCLRTTVQDYLISVRRFDTGKDGYLDLGELKRMMEKLGVPQTHLALKAMIKEVDEDGDDKISFREVRAYIYTYFVRRISHIISYITHCL